jgi:hypothetical protein
MESAASISCLKRSMRRRPQGDGYNYWRSLFYWDKNSRTARAASAKVAARSSVEDVEPIE